MAPSLKAGASGRWADIVDDVPVPAPRPEVLRLAELIPAPVAPGIWSDAHRLPPVSLGALLDGSQMLMAVIKSLANLQEQFEKLMMLRSEEQEANQLQHAVEELKKMHEKLRAKSERQNANQIQHEAVVEEELKGRMRSWWRRTRS